jgi:hypothetical protein
MSDEDMQAPPRLNKRTSPQEPLSNAAETVSDHILPGDWQVYDESGRDAARERVQARMIRPSFSPEIVEDLLRLVADNLVTDAYRQYCKLHSETAGVRSQGGITAHVRRERASVEAQASARVFRRQLLDLLSQDRSLTREIFLECLQWSNKRFAEGTFNLDKMLERLGDQLSACLVFRSLDPEKAVGIWAESLWRILFQRVVSKIIFRVWERPVQRGDSDIESTPAPGNPTGGRARPWANARYRRRETMDPEEEIQTCIALILQSREDRGQTPFEYMGVGQAIIYFCDMWDRFCFESGKKADKERVALELAAAYAHEDGTQEDWTALSFPFIEKVYGRANAIVYWILSYLRQQLQMEWTDICKLDTRNLQSMSVTLPDAVLWREVTTAFTAVEAKIRDDGGSWFPEAVSSFYERMSTIRDRRFPAFYEIRSALKSDRSAVKFWLLFILLEDRLSGRQKDQCDREAIWPEIASLVVQPRCRILGDSALPPGMTWQDAASAFAASACTAGALRTFYSRARRSIPFRKS